MFLCPWAPPSGGVFNRPTVCGAKREVERAPVVPQSRSVFVVYGRVANHPKLHGLKRPWTCIISHSLGTAEGVSEDSSLPRVAQGSSVSSGISLCGLHSRSVQHGVFQLVGLPLWQLRCPQRQGQPGGSFSEPSLLLQSVRSKCPHLALIHREGSRHPPFAGRHS